MSYSLVQSTHGNIFGSGWGGTSVVLSLATNSAVGNLLFFAGNSDHSASPNLIPSGLGTWARVGTVQTDGTHNQDCAIWYAVCTSAGTTVVVTTSGTINGSGAAMNLAELNGTTGFGALGVSDTTKTFTLTAVGADAETSSTVTPTSGDLYVAAFQQAQSQAGITPGTGWSSAGTVELGQSGTGANGIEFKSSSGAAEAATFTVTTDNDLYTVQVAAFHAGAGAAGFTNLVPPSVTGTLTIGQVLTANPGTWTGAGSFLYQWERGDDASGSNATIIGGATGSTYTLGSVDAGKYLRAFVDPEA